MFETPQRRAHAAHAIPLDEIDVSRPELHRDESVWAYFARLRAEDPVHYCRRSAFGPYWSVTKFKDIVHVESHPELFSSSSKLGGVTLHDHSAQGLPTMIQMDPPEHTAKRRAVTLAVGPDNLLQMEALARRRTAEALDALPVGETFDWVERVSMNLTTQMLATLFDFPWEDRAKLPYWSDVTTTLPGMGLIDSEEHRMQILGECAAYMMGLWNQRVNAPQRPDMISMLAHAEATRNMQPDEFLGNFLLLIVGGNDTTRNSMSGGVLALNRFPAEYAKLCANPGLIGGSLVSEIIRWQTPVAHFRRTATQDTELGGKLIRKGSKVALWYMSANRDAESIDRADEFIADRRNARHHVSFGFGVHRCVGNRLAELQLRILWEELLKRWPRAGQIEVVGEPGIVPSAFIRGYQSLPVRINP